MKILVTGGAGFISHLVDALARNMNLQQICDCNCNSKFNEENRVRNSGRANKFEKTYEKRDNEIVVVTFYPARRERYENQL